MFLRTCTMNGLLVKVKANIRQRKNEVTKYVRERGGDRELESGVLIGKMLTLSD